MSGILFFQTKDLHTVKKFYIDIGATVWLDQKYCVILKHGNLLLGFCQSESCDTSGIITFFYPEKKEVDALYNVLKERAETEPTENEKFSIYHFFAKDPEGRTVEFQCFLHLLNPYESGVEVLINRRSVRHYQDQEVKDDIL